MTLSISHGDALVLRLGLFKSIARSSGKIGFEELRTRKLQDGVQNALGARSIGSTRNSIGNRPIQCSDLFAMLVRGYQVASP